MAVDGPTIKYFVRLGEAERQLSEKTVRVVGPLLVAVLVGLFTFGVSMDMPVRSLDGLLGKAVSAYLKNACFSMIEPYRYAMERHEDEVTTFATTTNR